jgi:GAF domain-containing protein
MIRTLILHADRAFGRALAKALQKYQHHTFKVTLTTTLEEARQLVLQTAYPFDLFLIGEHLKSGGEGIEALHNLRELTPQAEAIILTSHNGQDTYKEGDGTESHCYLPEPFDIQELVRIMRSSNRSLTIYDERDWLTVLSEVAEEAQRALSVGEMAQIIVQGGIRLGFERARLWSLSDDGTALVGTGQAGHQGLENFIGLRMPVGESIYVQRALRQRAPSFFHGSEYGEAYMERHPNQYRFKLPVGEWLIMPLWSGDRCLGALTLDNANQSRPLRPEQRRLLDLFGRQVTAALERARLYELEARKSQELEVLNQIGQRVTTRAALVDLDLLLEEVYLQVGRLMDVSNFMVVLLDRETHQLVFRLHMANGKPKPRYRWHRLTGLVWHLITKNEPLLLPRGDTAYIEEQRIPRYGRRSRCWLGVPLRVGDTAEGSIVVWSHDQEQLYGEEDLRVLMAVADQVAGVIQIALVKEREEQNRRQLAMLNRASAEIVRLAEENADWLWHMLLTAATADYALGFNRAVLLFADRGGTRLSGCMGIGHFEMQKAHRAWREDQHLGFENYLHQLRTDKLKRTPVEEFMRQHWILDLSQDAGGFSLALKEGRSAFVPAAKAASLLPSFVEHFGATDYAVLPLRAGNKVLGVVVVDNIHNREPLRETALHHLETLLTQAALTWEALCQRRARDKLIELNHTVMTDLNSRSLKETLTQICQVAQASLDVDAATIYVLKPEREPYEFDTNNTAAVGQRTNFHLLSIPRPKGISSHILRSGPLVVSDFRHNDSLYDGQRLTDHPFHQAEHFFASIGLPLRDRHTGAPLGIIYLNSRTPRAFSDQDIRQAETFASLAALAIRNTWATRRAHQDLAAVKAERRDRERELDILRRVLTESLAADTEEEKVIRALLNAARELLDKSDARVGILLLELEKSGPSTDPLPELRGHYFRNPDAKLLIDIEPNPYRGITGTALRTHLSQLVNDVDLAEWAPAYDEANCHSKLVVPIKLGAQAIGVFDIKSPAAETFTTTHKLILERLAAAAALALDNVRRQKHLYTVLKAAQMVMAPIDLRETLNAVLEAARDTAPGLSALTIWYREPVSSRIVLGPYFGVRDEKGMRSEEPPEGSVVRAVIDASKPIWAITAREEPRLTNPHGRFVKEEGIESTAAFPLRADGEIVGAMFFNYRQRHEFTNEERALFPILVEITAASVRDAARLEAIRKDRDRLQTTIDISRAVGTTLSLDDTLRKIMEALRRLFPSAIPCVLIFDEAESALDITQASLEFYQISNPDYQRLIRMPLDGPSIACRIARAALASKKVEIASIGDVDTDPSYLKLIMNTRSELCVAAMSGNQLLGMIVLESPQSYAFQDDDIQLVRGVARQIGIAIDRARQSAQLRFRTSVGLSTAWAAEIAHEINGHVGLIRNRTLWLRNDQGLSQQSREAVREIESLANQLAGSLASSDLQQRHAPEEFPLDEQVGHWVREMVTERRDDITVQAAAGCGTLYIRSYPLVLQSVLRHLVRNALEAMQGPGMIMVRTLCGADNRFEIQIEDTGPGVPDEVRQSILQEPASTSGKGAGRGFGLLLARFAIENIGGNIRLLPSQPGQGAIFALTLPIEPAVEGGGAV